MKFEKLVEKREEEVWVEEDSVAETAGAAMKEVERNREFKTEKSFARKYYSKSTESTI